MDEISTLAKGLERGRPAPLPSSRFCHERTHIALVDAGTRSLLEADSDPSPKTNQSLDSTLPEM